MVAEQDFDELVKRRSRLRLAGMIAFVAAIGGGSYVTYYLREQGTSCVGPVPVFALAVLAPAFFAFGLLKAARNPAEGILGKVAGTLLSGTAVAVVLSLVLAHVYPTTFTCGAQVRSGTPARPGDGKREGRGTARPAGEAGPGGPAGKRDGGTGDRGR